jgi:microcystin-dependent protein
MTESFIGEIKLFGGNFAIQGYAFCDGTLLSIDQNGALFSLLGTAYGGDGQTTFALPDLRGRIPVHQGNGFILGQSSGTETVTLNTSQIPPHNHAVAADSNTGSSGNPQGNIVAGSSLTPYNTAAAANQMGLSTGHTGGSQPHDNIMPFQCLNYIIALEGYPPRN